jgi:hypothetical protein
MSSPIGGCILAFPSIKVAQSIEHFLGHMFGCSGWP